MLRIACLTPLALGALIVVGLVGCPPPNALHSLTLSVTPAGAGLVRATPDRSAYFAGTEITLEAIPNAGYVFRNWVGTGINTTQTPALLRIYADQTITAVFVPESGEGEGEGENPEGVVADPGFEDGPLSTAWTQVSTSFAYLICDATRCGTLESLAANTGSYWVYFGSDPTGIAEVASITQSVVMPRTGSATLEFFLAVPRAEAPFFFRVFLGRSLLFELTEADADGYNAYQRVQIDVSEYATGETVPLLFTYNNNAAPGAVIGVFLDDVSIYNAVGEGEGEGEAAP